MEAVEAFLDGEWESLSNLFSCEESDLHLHFNGVSNNQDHSSFYSASQESDEDGSAYLQSMDFVGQNDAVMVPVFSDDLMEEILQLKAHMCSAESDQKLLEAGMEMQVKSSVSEEYNSSDQCRKKRPRACRNVRNTQSRKKKKACSDEEVNNAPTTSSACSSDEAGDSEFVGKAKVVGKGPATDPQSLYARKRREKINERLKILQNLVPNGTKVDISTMLEEAVEYVKFLQLQIKLLSSDDLWMYAPIAYNGMDIGVYQKIVPNILG